MNNVKAGDTAYVVKPAPPQLVNLFVYVARQAGPVENLGPVVFVRPPAELDKVWWVVEGTIPAPVEIAILLGVATLQAVVLPDEWLRPIRDPGDDAVDGMVLRLGAAPKVETPVETHIQQKGVQVDTLSRTRYC